MDSKIAARKVIQIFAIAVVSAMIAAASVYLLSTTVLIGIFRSLLLLGATLLTWTNALVQHWVNLPIEEGLRAKTRAKLDKHSMQRASRAKNRMLRGLGTSVLLAICGAFIDVDTNVGRAATFGCTFCVALLLIMLVQSQIELWKVQYETRYLKRIILENKRRDADLKSMKSDSSVA